jgi:hypothetical protein
MCVLSSMMPGQNSLICNIQNVLIIRQSLHVSSTIGNAIPLTLWWVLLHHRIFTKKKIQRMPTAEEEEEERILGNSPFNPRHFLQYICKFPEWYMFESQTKRDTAISLRTKTAKCVKTRNHTQHHSPRRKTMHRLLPEATVQCISRSTPRPVLVVGGLHMEEHLLEVHP